MNQRTFLSTSTRSTLRLGKRLGMKLKAGTVIALMGELGCGKTLFTKGICLGLGIPVRSVNSPTFVLVNEYKGRFPVFHIDLYRVSDVGDGLEIGILDYLVKVSSGVMVVEWAERILPLLPQNHLQVHFSVLPANRRKIVLVGLGEESRALVRGL